jgi:ribosomal protein S18 acetylase RimI-like enzyme
MAQAQDEIAVRGYRDGDLGACRGLWVELTEQHRQIYDAPWIGGEDPGSQFDTHLERVGADRLWVAVAGGTVVGLTGLQPKDEGIEIEPVVVATSHRGRGIGRLLVETAVAGGLAAGHQVISVGVVGRNRQATGFYHAMGFDVVGEIELMYDTREGADQRWKPGDTIAGLPFRN